MVERSTLLDLLLTEYPPSNEGRALLADAGTMLREFVSRERENLPALGVGKDAFGMQNINKASAMAIRNTRLGKPQGMQKELRIRSVVGVATPR
jgi:hypothetical protein